MNHKGTVTLETERLILRRFEIADAEAMFNNWANDAEVTKYLTWPTHTDVSVSKSVIDSWLPLYENPNHYRWAIILKEIDEPIGSIAAVGQREDIKMVHIGYCIGRKWWQQGYTSEALAELIRFFFEEVGVNRIESKHDPRNPNSGKVMMKSGLQYEGSTRQDDISNQGICDSVRYAIFADEYFGKDNDAPKGYIMDLRKIVGHRPLIQVGASIIVDNGKGEILLERRKDNGLWEYPAGSMDLGESLDETAKRELFEETGLIAKKLKPYDFLHTETLRNVYPNGDVVYNVIGRYVCTEWTGILHPQASEVTELRWFSFNELPKDLAPGKKDRIEEYLAWRKLQTDWEGHD